MWTADTGSKDHMKCQPRDCLVGSLSHSLAQLLALAATMPILSQQEMVVDVIKQYPGPVQVTHRVKNHTSASACAGSLDVTAVQLYHRSGLLHRHKVLREIT